MTTGSDRPESGLSERLRELDTAGVAEDGVGDFGEARDQRAVKVDEGPGQLEDEIMANGWLTCDALPSLVFDQDDEGKWEAALKTLGVDPLTLSSTAGHA